MRCTYATDEQAETHRESGSEAHRKHQQKSKARVSKTSQVITRRAAGLRDL